MSRYWDGTGGDNVLFDNSTPTALRSVSVWFLRDNAVDTTARRIWEYATTAPSLADQLIWSTSEPFRLQVGWSTASGVWEVTSAPSLNAWHNLVFTYSDSSVDNDPIIYLDGVSVAFTEITKPSGTVNGGSTFLVRLGNRFDNGRDWEGYIAEYARWNRILTPQEAKSMAKFSPIFYKRGLIFYAPLIGNQSPEYDIVGRQTGTVSNATKGNRHPPIIYPRNFR